MGTNKMEVGDTFDCFEEFSTRFKQYQSDVCANFRIQDSTTVERARKKQRRRMFRNELRYAYMKFVCQRGGIYKASGKGLRPNQRSVRSDCPAHMIIGASSDGNKLVVREIHSNHNHPRTAETFKHSTLQRRLDKEDVDYVVTLLNHGANTKTVKEHMAQVTGKVVTSKDIYNIRTKVRETGKTSAPVQMDIEVVNEMPAAFIDIACDDSNYDADMKIQDFRLNGFTCAPLTPFTDAGDVNYRMIEQYAQHLIDFNIKNLFVAGTTGEANSLSVAERKKVAEAWVTIGREKFSAIIIQVGSGCLPDSVELARHAQDVGADAISCVGPTYYKPATLHDYVSYMQKVAAAAPNLPFYLYDIDFITGIHFSALEFCEKALPIIPTLRGVKHTSPSFPRMHLLHGRYSARIQVIQGCDETYLEGLALGIEDVVVQSHSGLVLSRVKQAFDAGDMNTARHYQLRLVEAWSIMRRHFSSVPAFSKAIAKLMNIDMGQPRPPLSPVTDKKVELLRKELTEIGFFDWVYAK